MLVRIERFAGADLDMTLPAFVFVLLVLAGAAVLEQPGLLQRFPPRSASELVRTSAGAVSRRPVAALEVRNLSGRPE